MKRRKRTQRPAYRRLLLPTDGTSQSAKGVRTAITLARALGAHVTVLYAAAKRPLDVGVLHEGRVLVEHEQQRQMAREKRVLEAVRAAAAAAGVSCSAAAASDGPSWRGILRVARKRRCDLIVISARAPTGIGRFVLQGLAGRVIARSPIALLIVR